MTVINPSTGAVINKLPASGNIQLLYQLPSSGPVSTPNQAPPRVIVQGPPGQNITLPPQFQAGAQLFVPHNLPHNLQQGQNVTTYMLVSKENLVNQSPQSIAISMVTTNVMTVVNSVVGNVLSTGSSNLGQGIQGGFPAVQGASGNQLSILRKSSSSQGDHTSPPSAVSQIIANVTQSNLVTDIENPAARNIAPSASHGSMVTISQSPFTSHPGNQSESSATDIKSDNYRHRSEGHIFPSRPDPSMTSAPYRQYLEEMAPYNKDMAPYSKDVGHQYNLSISSAPPVYPHQSSRHHIYEDNMSRPVQIDQQNRQSDRQSSESQIRQSDSQIRQQELHIRQPDSQIRQSESHIRQQDLQIRQSDNQMRQSDSQIRQSDNQIRQSDSQMRQVGLNDGQPIQVHKVHHGNARIKYVEVKGSKENSSNLASNPPPSYSLPASSGHQYNQHLSPSPRSRQQSSSGLYYPQPMHQNSPHHLSVSTPGRLFGVSNV